MALWMALAAFPFGGLLAAAAPPEVRATTAALVALAIAGHLGMFIWVARRLSRPFAGPAAGGIGWCNIVTAGRAGLVWLLAAVLVLAPLDTAPALAWAALVLAVIALALDGFDGWLARRRGEASEFGARFDMEVDAALILVLACLAWLSGKAGVWVLALGLMRYGFVLAGRHAAWLRAPLPPSLRRKAVCVLQVAVLALLVAPTVGPTLGSGLAAVALAALIWSFAIDTLWLWRHRPETRIEARGQRKAPDGTPAVSAAPRRGPQQHAPDAAGRGDAPWR